MGAIKEKALIRLIHARCRELGISADERRDLQVQVTGKASLTEMGVAQLEDVVHQLNLIGKGVAPADEWRFVFRLTPDRQRFAKKIYRLAEKIGAMQEPPVPIMSKDYIEGIARRMAGGVDTLLEFCDAERLHKIVQALEVHISRHGGHGDAC